jgi:hypothetical protein
MRSGPAALHRIQKGCALLGRLTKTLYAMKIILYILLLTSPIIGMAQTAVEGGYIVVRGAVKDCEAWGNRILDAVKIENQAPITILEIPGFSVIGQDHDQVENELSDAIKTITGNKPSTLTVEILISDAEYQAIAKEHLMSLKVLLDGECPLQKAKGSEQRREEELERMRLMEISRRIALREAYNKAFKYVPALRASTEPQKAASFWAV